MGLILSLLAVSVLGQRMVIWLGIASDPRGWFKRVIGALFLIIGIIIATGYSMPLESTILSHAGVFDVTQVEQMLLGAQNSNNTIASTIPLWDFSLLPKKRRSTKKRPSLPASTATLILTANPITLASLKGKVVLIDFWTYSCINCLRTIPYLNAWYAKYKDQGLVIIGVETPEFAFEHVNSNVETAVKNLGIQYPVVQDNEYATWNAFNNEYWPNDYLVDIDGYIVDQHSGEGDYAETEAAIQQALAERARPHGNAEASTTA